jgi:tRNA A37 threonylcarbamoyladenosine dehydratase
MNEQDWMCRTELLINKEGLDTLKKSHVLIVGLGGVGGIAAEQLCRSGIGRLTLVDNDTVQLSNINRQVIALHSTVGHSKTSVLKKRLLDINPDVKINTVEVFIENKQMDSLLSEPFDFVIDAIDTLTPKVDLLAGCIRKKIPVVSSMGSGGRMEPSKIFIDDIKKSHDCKFAYLVRKYLHKKDIYEGIKVVYSTEKVPDHALIETDGSNYKRTIVGTISYMPTIFGCLCASAVINGILNTKSSQLTG